MSLTTTTTESEPTVLCGRRRVTERGASLTEYALLLALIGVACIGAFSQMSSSQEDGLNGSTSKITSAIDGAGG